MNGPARSPEPPDHPDLPVKPPLVFLVSIVIGVGTHHLAPMRAGPAGRASVGVAIVALAVALLVWAALSFRSRRTPLEPWKPTTAIVDFGPFAFSRNPVYLAFALIQVGFGLWTDRLAVVAMVVPALLATNAWIVPREEAYLERKFGAEYVGYRRRVRRWL